MPKVILTTLFDPASLLANTPVAVIVKMSLDNLPVNTALLLFIVALVVPSYTLLLAVIPLTVIVFVVILVVVVF